MYSLSAITVTQLHNVTSYEQYIPIHNYVNGIMEMMHILPVRFDMYHITCIIGEAFNLTIQ